MKRRFMPPPFVASEATVVGAMDQGQLQHAGGVGLQQERGRGRSAGGSQRGKTRKVDRSIGRIEHTYMPHHDGYLWRKYGQKKICGSPYPRSYFRCGFHDKRDCKATKYVQQLNTDFPALYRVTYGYQEHRCTPTVIYDVASLVNTSLDKHADDGNHYTSSSLAGSVSWCFNGNIVAAAPTAAGGARRADVQMKAAATKQATSDNIVEVIGNIPSMPMGDGGSPMASLLSQNDNAAAPAAPTAASSGADHEMEELLEKLRRDTELLKPHLCADLDWFYGNN